MNQREHRGVSLGTIVMLSLTLAVLIGCGAVLPKLMGSANIHIEDRAMLSSVNLNDSLPSLTMSVIPITGATEVPSLKAEPVATKAMAAETASATEAPVSPTPVIGGTVNLTLGGSICMDDLIRKSGYYADSEKYDYTDNLALIADELNSDYTFVTLETVTEPEGNVRELPNAPAVVMDMLAQAHVDMVALGYNRAFELGLTGLQSTVAQAQARKLATVGAYSDEADANQLRIVEIDNVRVAYLHYTNTLTSTSRRKRSSASAEYALPTAEIDGGADAIALDVARARDAGANIVIVSLNWSGSESINPNTTKMKRFMQALADAGADVIVGAGTKAVKEVEWFMGNRSDGTTRQTLCAWSLGSLLNGGRNDGNVAGMLLHLQLSYAGNAVSFERVSYTPTYIWRFKEGSYYRYRVVASDLPAPEGMDSTQADNAARAYANIRKALGDSPITLRTK